MKQFAIAVILITLGASTQAHALETQVTGVHQAQAETQTKSQNINISMNALAGVEADIAACASAGAFYTGNGCSAVPTCAVGEVLDHTGAQFTCRPVSASSVTLDAQEEVVTTIPTPTPPIPTPTPNPNNNHNVNININTNVNVNNAGGGITCIPLLGIASRPNDDGTMCEFYCAPKNKWVAELLVASSPTCEM